MPSPRATASVYWRCSTLLLPADLSPDDASNAGQTPLLLLLGARAEPGAACDEDVLLAVLERLLNEDVASTRRTSAASCALHLAAMHGLLRDRAAAAARGRQSPVPAIRSAAPRTTSRVLRGFVDIASEFEPTRAAPSLARFLREPR